MFIYVPIEPIRSIVAKWKKPATNLLKRSLILTRKFHDLQALFVSKYNKIKIYDCETKQEMSVSCLDRCCF